MQASPNQAPNKPRSADPLKQHACVVAIIRFADGNVRSFYSRDVDHRNDYRYHNKGFWTSYWQKRIENESPTGWQGRVDEAAIFHSFDGNRGDKICQWIKAKGGWQA